MRKLLGTANALGGLGVLFFLLYVVRPSAAFQPIHQPIRPGVAAPERRTVEKPRPVGEYGTCWTKGVPASPEPAAAAAPQNGPAPAPSNLKFISAFFTTGPEGRQGYAAIIDGKDERIYGEREEVAGYVVASISPETVILEKDGRQFTLDRQKPPAVPAARTAPRETPGGRRTPPGGAARRGSRTRTITPRERMPEDAEPPPDTPDDTSFEEDDGSTEASAAKNLVVASKDRDYVVNNFAKILHDVNLQTELDDAGSMTGVKIGHIKPGSILSKIGHLRKGDIIRKVNGTPITSVPQAVSLYEQLSKQNVKTVNVEIERDGKVFSHNYNIGGMQP